MRRAQLTPITFPAYDSTSPLVRKSGLTFIAGDVKISKDGGAFVNVTNLPVEISTTGVYQFNLTAAECDCLWLHVMATKAGMGAVDVCGETSGHPSFAVIAGTLSATSFPTNLVSAVNDAWKGALVVFTTGALKDQYQKVTGYNGTTKTLTFASAFTGAPSVGDLALLVNT